MVRKRSEMVRKLPGNGLEMVRKWSVNGQEIVRTWSLNGQEMALLLDLSRQLHSCLFHEHIEGGALTAELGTSMKFNEKRIVQGALFGQFVGLKQPKVQMLGKSMTN